MKEVLDHLQEIGQRHLERGLDTLSSSQCHAFLNQLKRYGPKLRARQRALIRDESVIDLSSARPVSDVQTCGMISDQLLGQRLIAEGKVGCLILAGGQGTRLGHQGPKGTLPIAPITNKSLFQLFSERIACAGKRAKKALPVAIMTSPLNDAPTRSFFEEHALFGLERSQLTFFSQGMLPLLDWQGNWLLSEPGMLAEGPDGNGHALHHFFQRGIGEQWRSQGVEYVHVIFIDNPLADPFDSEFVGFTSRCDLDIGMKVVERLSSHEKMGIVVREKEKLKVIEYSEFFPEESRCFSLASPGLFCFRMEFIQNLCDQQIQIPLHLARKTAWVIPVDSQTRQDANVLKCETFQFDLLDFTDKSAAILYPRNRTYAPIKNAQGDKSPDTARASLLAYDKLIYSELSGQAAPSFAFELDPAFYYPSDEIRNQMWGRRLLECGYITVEML